MAYVRACPIEINGFGYVKSVGGDLFVTDVFILDQRASSGSVETDQRAMAQHVTGMLTDGDDPDRIKFQWHSHVRGDAYFSQTDLENIERWPGNWLISLVANYFGEYSCRIDSFASLRLGVSAELTILMDIPSDLELLVQDEVRRHVRRRLRAVSPTEVADPTVTIGAAAITGGPPLDENDLLKDKG